VGCGVGDVSFFVAALVGPDGSVVGVDLDVEALKLVEKRRTAQEITKVEFRQSDLRSVDSGLWAKPAVQNSRVRPRHRDILDILDQLRDELVPAHGFTPLSWLTGPTASRSE
jgi:hypothetical protein